MTEEMTSALAATGPRPEHKEALALYGRLAGTWDVRNKYFDESSGTWVTGTVVWTVRSPYVLVGGHLETEGRGAKFALSWDGKAWACAPSC